MSKLQAMHPLVLVGILAAVPDGLASISTGVLLPSLSTLHHCHPLEDSVSSTSLKAALIILLFHRVGLTTSMGPVEYLLRYVWLLFKLPLKQSLNY